MLAACVWSALRAAPAYAQADAPKLELRERWVYYSTNLLVDKNVDTMETVMRRAAKADYNGVMLADSKFGRLKQMPPRYFANAQRVRKLADELNLKLVPAVFPLGYSEAILSQDPNLAEALPVRDALFVVKGGEARLVAAPQVSLPGGDFANLTQWTWKDDTVAADQGAARVTDPNGKNARLTQKLAVRPFRQYHVSVRIKTQDFKGTPEIKVLAASDPKSLNFASLGVKPTQDWTEHHIVFNSLDHEQVSLYLGCWDGRTGSLWFDDARIEEVGLLNVVRRAGAPLAVRRDGAAAEDPPLVEGKDFQPITDPRMGVTPWPGSYEVWHQPPTIKTNLPDGTRLRVSYFHAITVYHHQVMICPSEPRTSELLAEQAQRVHEAFAAPDYFMSHDEIRVLNWDKACADRQLDAGAILAENVKTCTDILRKLNPGGDVYVWSDMFDPHHNAHANYYLVRGDLTGSWQGLGKNVNIVLWHHAQRDPSMRFFAQRGHRMLIAGYYDANPQKMRDWLDSARQLAAQRKAGPGEQPIIGAMYTTWRNNYDDLETFAAIVDEYRK